MRTTILEKPVSELTQLLSPKDLSDLGSTLMIDLEMVPGQGGARYPFYKAIFQQLSDSDGWTDWGCAPQTKEALLLHVLRGTWSEETALEENVYIRPSEGWIPPILKGIQYRLRLRQAHYGEVTAELESQQGRLTNSGDVSYLDGPWVCVRDDRNRLLKEQLLLLAIATALNLTLPPEQRLDGEP